jgi:hypothetical protein
MIDLSDSKWVFRVLISVSGKHPFFLIGGIALRTLIRVKVSYWYVDSTRIYCGRLLILSGNVVVTYRDVFLNEEFLWYFPINEFKLKFIPHKFLPLCQLTVKEYIYPISSIDSEDLKALG